jgi:YVTN family beta-propeller protein
MLARLVTLFLFAIPSFGSIAYISNCCSHPSSVNVFQANSGAQTAQWTAGQNAYGAVYSPDGTKVYVSNTNSQSVSVLQTATGMTLATIPVGLAEQAMAISADGKRLYVSSYEYAYLSHVAAIDTATNTVAGVMEFKGAVLAGLALSPDGRSLYTNVLDFGGSSVNGLVSIDTNSLTIASTTTVAGVDVAVTPDGRFLYVPVLGSAGNSGNVTVISASTNTVVATIAIPPNVYPGFARITPDGTQAWVGASPLTNSASPLIMAISTSTLQITTTIPFPNGISVGRILFSPDSKKAYVVGYPSTVEILSVPAAKLVSHFAAAGIVNQPGLSPDGKWLAVPNSGTADAAAIDTATDQILASVPIGAMDFGNQLYLEYGGLAVSPDGARAYATNYASGTVSVIDTASKKAIRSVPVGSNPIAVAVSPDSSTAYVANSYSSSVTVISAKTFATLTIALPLANSGYPSSIAISPDGKRVYVAVNNGQPDFGIAACWIVGIDTSSNQVVSATKVFYPMALTVSPDGASIYFIGGLAETLYTISTATNRITHSVLLQNGSPTQPVTGGIAVTPDGTRVFASDGSFPQVYEVDVTANKLIQTILVGQMPGTIAITADGMEAWVAENRGTAVHVISVADGTVARSIWLGNQSYGIAFGPR